MTLNRRTALRRLTALGTTASLGASLALSAGTSAGAGTEDTDGNDDDKTDSDHETSDRDSEGENANAGDSEGNTVSEGHHEVHLAITDGQTGEPIVDAHERVGISIDGGLVPIDEHSEGEPGTVLMRLADGTHDVRVASYPVWMHSIVCIHVDGEDRTATVGLPGGPEFDPDAARDPSFDSNGDSETEGQGQSED